MFFVLLLLVKASWKSSPWPVSEEATLSFPKRRPDSDIFRKHLQRQHHTHIVDTMQPSNGSSFPGVSYFHQLDSVRSIFLPCLPGTQRVPSRTEALRLRYPDWAQVCDVSFGIALGSPLVIYSLTSPTSKGDFYAVVSRISLALR
jgi:hypothetical protein